MIPARIEIVGGGLAGLSLGLALRGHGVPVTIFEAGSYPRHRVCGEFITGLDAGTRARLGLNPLLAGARSHREVRWFQLDRALCRQQLPAPALAISRYLLDARLAEAFVSAGGILCTQTRLDPVAVAPGRINATGRRRTASAWIGLKVHARGFDADRGLEMHLGRGAYVGLCQLAGGEVNICGLFQRCVVPDGLRSSALGGYLRACGFNGLADRLHAAEICPGSESAVAGLGFGPPARDREPRLGDAHCMLPPFFGNGMASAFQMADEMTQPLADWARHGGSWAATCRVIRGRLARRFRRRITLGALLHPLVLSPFWQRGLGWLSRAHGAPLRLLYQGLH